MLYNTRAYNLSTTDIDFTLNNIVINDPYIAQRAKMLHKKTAKMSKLC